MSGTSKIKISVCEVLDHTHSGSDLDINYLYDESDSDISDLDDDSISTQSSYQLATSATLLMHVT